jgi:hypothetical protein
MIQDGRGMSVTKDQGKLLADSPSYDPIILIVTLILDLLL